MWAHTVNMWKVNVTRTSTGNGVIIIATRAINLNQTTQSPLHSLTSTVCIDNDIMNHGDMLMMMRIMMTVKTMMMTMAHVYGMTPTLTH